MINDNKIFYSLKEINEHIMNFCPSVVSVEQDRRARDYVINDHKRLVVKNTDLEFLISSGGLYKNADGITCISYRFSFLERRNITLTADELEWEILNRGSKYYDYPYPWIFIRIDPIRVLEEYPLISEEFSEWFLFNLDLFNLDLFNYDLIED